MREKTSLLIVLLIFAVLACGCTDSDTQRADAQNAPVTTKYQPGDIIDEAPTNDDPCWLVLSYDSKTDEYETAVIFKYDDGTWGYRLNEDSDWDKRDFIEEYYPAYITHVKLSDVKIGDSSRTPELKYRPGDIIDEAPTNSDPCWVILTYDPETDEYERAVIFKYDDGTWGYRLDADTTWSERTFTEEYYPAYIAHVDPGRIRIGYQY